MTIERLGTVAAEVAMKAAVAYVHSEQVVVTEAIITDLLEALRVTVKEAVGPALDDAREAFEAGMPQVAEATFVASMRIAGIKAAKLVIGLTRACGASRSAGRPG